MIFTVLTSDFYIFNFITWWNKISSWFQLSTCDWRTVLPSSRLWSLSGPWLVQLWFGSLVQIVAVAAVGPVVALAELPDPTTSLHHHLLWQSHHNAKEVRILECLGKDRAKILLDFKVITLAFSFIHKLKCEHIGTNI